MRRFGTTGPGPVSNSILTVIIPNAQSGAFKKVYVVATNYSNPYRMAEGYMDANGVCESNCSGNIGPNSTSSSTIKLTDNSGNTILEMGYDPVKSFEWDDEITFTMLVNTAPDSTTIGFIFEE